ncbi:MAG TPA: nucleotidyl transferase AbiEii/AbiGii toxin family protein [Candidatus Egerieousia sp.]|nr:nucleotidyl transferase AbiEii/AbiGii toxin family protein [Candidatus Egerieousia sp.]HPT05256.1 nucleotidyl transferase AbiEii/AbiGii toxin family protein [Candidatus Egerieousia sp.]
MNNFYQLTEEQKRLIITQSAEKAGLDKQIIEKDLWVTTILQILFSLDVSKYLVFKGGTSLSKVWGVIERFSEDIDVSIDRRFFGLDGDLTKKQIKKLRKESSLFVSKELFNELVNEIDKFHLSNALSVAYQTDGEGDNAYPEPRQIYITYNSLFENVLAYIKPIIILEVGSRSLFEPMKSERVKSVVEYCYHNVITSVCDSEIHTAVPEKTFLEKAFLLHELFSTDGARLANRKSRHLYDLERMMDLPFATKAIEDDNLWDTIHHHRDIFTHMKDVDYTPDIRDRISLVPPQKYMQTWEEDYNNMRSSMIYGKTISFNELIARMHMLENKFRNHHMKE